MRQARSSRQRYANYRKDLAAHRTEGTKHSGAAEKQSGRKRRGFFALFGAFWSFLHGHRGALWFALITATVATCLNLIPPAATGFVIDSVIGGKPLPGIIAALRLPADRVTLLTITALGLLAITLVSIVIGMWGRWKATQITKHLQAELRRDVFDHAVRLPLHRVQALKSGGAASILREDAGGVAELIFSMIYNPWKAITRLLGTLIILAFIDWRMLVGAVVLLPIVYITHRTWIGRIRPVFRDIRATRQHTDSHATEAFGGMRVVRSFGRQRSEATRFLKNNHLLVRQEMLAWWWSRIIEIAWGILIPGALAALLWFGGMQVIRDQERVAQGIIAAEEAVTIGELVMFLMYITWLLGPLEVLASSATQFQNSLAGLDRVLDLLEEPREMEREDAQPKRTMRREQARGRVTFNHVTFRYPGTPGTPGTEADVLHEIELDVQPGENIALVGPSGAGKTTLCNLVARFYDPTEGSIELDGVDLREYDVEHYRRLLGIVEQDIFLFDGTIAENIGYGRRGATLEEIREAARIANADGFIESFSKGYETIIGERGVRLSGGQRQRIAIARAVLADPRILILDEATSNLDTESERRIQESLHRLMRGRTSFVIAHRLSTIRDADRIAVMEHGRIIELGSHDELMARSGRYEKLVFMQLYGSDGERGAMEGMEDIPGEGGQAQRPRDPYAPANR